MFTTDILLGVVSVILLYKVTFGNAEQKYCLSCKGASKPRDCGYVQVCDSHSNCYTDSYIDTLGDIRYNMGCKDTQKCSQSPLGKRYASKFNVESLTAILQKTNGAMLRLRDEVQEDSGSEVTICQDCCSGDLCNAHLCTTEGFPSTRGPVCFQCAQSLSSRRCNQITVCGRDEVCHLTSSEYLGDTIYTTSCKSRLECVNRGTLDEGPVSIWGKRESKGVDRAFPKPSLCEKCCSTDLCNVDNCTSLRQLLASTKHPPTTTAETIETTTPDPFTSPPRQTLPDAKPPIGYNDCVDFYPNNCPDWAKRGYCVTNSGYMLLWGKRSCNHCNCVDDNAGCVDWARLGHCKSNAGYMLFACKKSCNNCV